MDRRIKVSRKPMRAMALALGLGLVSGCTEGANNGFFKPADATAGNAVEPSKSTKLVERDVEAPEVFQVTESGLWDGRPSLGGVWVAHPDVTDPQRVIIRNSANGKFVIGALFRREREIPGPRIQASSDAAAALGMLAGAPVELNITALIRESVPDEIPEEEAIPTVIETPDEEIAQTTLDPVAGAAAAIDAAAPTPVAVAKPVANPAPKPKTKPKPSSLGKPYIQIGIFNVKANAEQTANQMRSAGMVPTVFEQSANGKPFWRVVVGPAQSKSERNALLKKVKATGFSDAYFVSN
jgi:cell division septation protein DedD